MGARAVGGRDHQGRARRGAPPRRLPRRDLRVVAVFVDTSALYALLAETADEHRLAQQVLQRLRMEDELLLTHSYVMLETIALLQRRAGLGPVRQLHERLAPALTITWVDAELHHRALAATLRGYRGVSLVDHTSFTLMRQRNIRRAFAFDDHFSDEGFELEAASL